MSTYLSLRVRQLFGGRSNLRCLFNVWDRHVASLLAMTALVFFLPFTLLYAEDPLTENQARFGELKGTVEVLSQGASKWIEAHKELPLETGDQVRVGDDGEADISVSQHALWALQPNSHIIVGHTESNSGRITLTSGDLLGKVDAPAEIPQAWEFETPTAVCAVRGTEFALHYAEAEGTHLGVVKGTMDMRPAETATQTFEPVSVRVNEEGVALRGKPLQRLPHFSPVMEKHLPQFVEVRRRAQRNRHEWSPHTVGFRQELRRKFVAPVKPAPKVNRPPRLLRRRPPH